MLSRVAETIYWIGRYLERAENTARLISVNTTLMLDLPKDMAPAWEPMVSLLGCHEDYQERHEEVTERRVTHFLIADQDNAASIISILALARENARTIREVLPREGWEKVNAMYQEMDEALHPSISRRDRQRLLNMVIEGVQTLTGLLAGTMNHDLAYMFLNVGRKIERADMTSRIVDMRWGSDLAEQGAELRPFEDLFWMSILKTLGAYQMYRQTMQVRISRKQVLEFLFQKDAFPRSLSYCLVNIQYNLAKVPLSESAISEADNLYRSLKETAIDEMDDEVLHGFIDHMQIHFGRLHTIIAETWFLQPPEQSQTQVA